MVKSDYRVVLEEGIYSIREVFYDNEDQVDYVGDEQITPIGEDWDEFVEELEMFQEAITMPVIISSDGEFKELEEM